MTVVASNYARKENDLYQTEPWATEALLRVFPVSGLTVWEPAAGNHLLADVLREAGAEVVTSDIATYDRAHNFIMDFLENEDARSTKCKPSPRTGRQGSLAVAGGGDPRVISFGEAVPEGDVSAVRGKSGDVLFGAETDGAFGQAEMENWAGEWSLQRRNTKHSISQNDRENDMRPLRQQIDAFDTPSGRSAYQQRGQQPRSALFPVSHEPPQDRMVARSFDCIITNPPFGKGNRDAVKFAELALKRCNGLVALLLTAKFDFGKTRQHLFGDCPRFMAKIALLDRIQWFPGETTGTEDHAWYVWGPDHYVNKCMAWEGREPAAWRKELAA